MIKTLCLSVALALSCGLVQAEEKAAPSKAKSKAAAAKAADKPVAKTTTAKVSKSTKASKTVVAKAAPTADGNITVKTTAAALAATDGAQATDLQSLAQRVYVGEMACELGASVRVAADEKEPGHFHLEGKGFKYHMTPVATSTGAVRLEDAKAGAVWLQIGNKSMLMDQKRGQRMADECKGPEQVAVAEALKKAPPPNLLETTASAK